MAYRTDTFRFAMAGPADMSKLVALIEEGAAHNEGAWSRRLPEALLFLYGR